MTARARLPPPPSPQLGFAHQPEAQQHTDPGSSSSDEHITATVWLPPHPSPQLHQHDTAGQQHSQQLAPLYLKSDHQNGPSHYQKSETTSTAAETGDRAQVQQKPHRAGALSAFQRAIQSNFPTVSDTKACVSLVPASAESPPLQQRSRVNGGPRVGQEGPQSPQFIKKGDGDVLEEAGTPPLSIRASSTLQELLKSNCGRNAQSAIREVLACLAAEERLLEDSTAPHLASPNRESHERGAVGLGVGSSSDNPVRRAVPFDGATDTSQSHDTLLEASMEASVGISFQCDGGHSHAVTEDRDVVNCVDSDTDSHHGRHAYGKVLLQPRMHVLEDTLGDHAYDREETVRVVASSCEFDVHGGDALLARSGTQTAASAADEHISEHGREWRASSAAHEKHPKRAVQTKFSLVSGYGSNDLGYHRTGEGRGVGESSLDAAHMQMYSLQSLPSARDGASVQLAQRTRQYTHQQKGPGAKGGPGRRVGASSALRSNSHTAVAQMGTVGIDAAATKTAPRKPIKTSKAAHKKLRSQRGRSSARCAPMHASMPEHPAWKPPCGPLSTSVEAPRTRASPLAQSQSGRAPPTTAPAPPRAAKGKLKAKRSKRVKAKRSVLKGPAGTHASAADGEQWEWNWVREGNATGAVAGILGAPVDTTCVRVGGLERMFGTKESRAATLAQIRGVQAATAMAATAHLRQVCLAQYHCTCT